MYQKEKITGEAKGCLISSHWITKTVNDQIENRNKIEGSENSADMVGKCLLHQWTHISC